jgi:DNA-binding response OmpR family regulator
MAELKKRILVVDDDQRLRELVVRYLTEQGFEARAVSDAPAMDRQLSRERYDLIVLDLMLPGEDGLAICRRLRGTNAGGNAAPASAPAIIMLTAKGDEVDRIVGLEMGADDYLPKPFNPRELVARVNAVLRRRQPAGRQARQPPRPRSTSSEPSSSTWPRAALRRKAKPLRSRPANSRCSRYWCSTRASRYRATSSWS